MKSRDGRNYIIDSDFIYCRTVNAYVPKNHLSLVQVMHEQKKGLNFLLSGL